jgi:hypothetical protein
VGGAGAAADGAAAPVEEDDVNVRVAANGRKALLGPMKPPLAGQDATVLVAVAVADHHLLLRQRCDAGSLRGCAARGRMLQEVGKDLRTRRHHRINGRRRPFVHVVNTALAP